MKRSRQSSPRRKNEGLWYYHFDPAADDESFWIVHKRFWHLHHHIDDRSLNDLMQVPRGFSEEMGSGHGYYGDTPEQAEQLLQQSGIAKLAHPLWQRGHYKGISCRCRSAPHSRA
jgi:hypothetical protein